MTFRFILQPAMAAIAAWRDGVSDARLGRRPYLWALLRGVRGPEGRSGRLWEGIISTARILILGIVMDAIYQWLVLKTFYPAPGGGDRGLAGLRPLFAVARSVWASRAQLGGTEGVQFLTALLR